MMTLLLSLALAASAGDPAGSAATTEQTAKPVELVAREAGFKSYERLRKTFARRLRVAPAAYRARFCRVPSTNAFNIAAMTGVYGPPGAHLAQLQ